jgi:anti-sigma-K factor RskA
MARELSHEELEELLGAYALDAVSGDERGQIERYLERSPRARAEVAELRETAALLAHAGGDAPEGLWDRIEQSLGAEAPRLRPPSTPGVTPLGRAGRRGRVSAAAAVAAVAAAVTIVALSVQVVRQDDRLDELTADAGSDGVLGAAEAASRDPDAREVSLTSNDGALEADLVYLPDGTGYLSEDNLPKLGSDRVYQLWALVGDGPRAISAGVLGADPKVVAFRFSGPVVGFSVTDEHEPGEDQPKGPAIVRGTLGD